MNRIMKIEKIYIKNFRIFKGDIKIAFNQNHSNNNISIIAGQNGYGKTTFLTAILWGFYGRLIAEVDDKYRREIYEAGGYKNFINSILNRDISDDESSAKEIIVEIVISNILILQP